MLSALHSAIIAHLTAAVPGLALCAAYPVLTGGIVTPAVAVELSEFAPADIDESTLGVTTRFTAFCLYDPNAPNAEIEVRNLAATVALRLHQGGNFGQDGVRAGRFVQAQPDAFRPDLDGYLVWAVEWEHDVILNGEPWNPAALGSFQLFHAEHSMVPGTQEPAAIDDVVLEGA